MKTKYQLILWILSFVLLSVYACNIGPDESTTTTTTTTIPQTNQNPVVNVEGMYPTNNQVYYSSKPLFQWNEISNAIKYTLRIGVTNIEIALSTNSYQVDYHLVRGTNFWNIIASNEAGLSYSETNSLIIGNTKLGTSVLGACYLAP